MTLLLTGGTGLLGKEVKRKFTDIISPTSKELDVSDKQKVIEFFKQNSIDGVIHAAAITSITECEQNKNKAWKVNVEGTKNLVEGLKKYSKNGYFIYISTPCIFDGEKEIYFENDIPDPVNFYGLTKLLGETIVSRLENYVIVRTNFVGRIKWPYEKAFVDRYGTYLFADNVADALLEIYQKRIRGTIHITGDKVFSMFDIARITTPSVQPLTLNEYNGPHLTRIMNLGSKRWKEYRLSVN